MSWRDKAIHRIAHCLLEYEAQCACLGEPANPKMARKYINDRYPFGRREYTPYKIWLSELKLLKTFIESRQPAIHYINWRLQIDSKGYRKGARRVVTDGQLSLFDE